MENCNRNDVGKYIFIVENNSGSKLVIFIVKVLDFLGLFGFIIFKDVIRGFVILMWDVFFFDGGVRIYYYVVEKREVSRRSW